MPLFLAGINAYVKLVPRSFVDGVLGGYVQCAGGIFRPPLRYFVRVGGWRVGGWRVGRLIVGWLQALLTHLVSLRCTRRADGPV